MASLICLVVIAATWVFISALERAITAPSVAPLVMSTERPGGCNLRDACNLVTGGDGARAVGTLAITMRQPVSLQAWGSVHDQ